MMKCAQFNRLVSVLGLSVALLIPMKVWAESLKLTFVATLNSVRLPAGETLPDPWKIGTKVDAVMEFAAGESRFRDLMPELHSSASVNDVAMHTINYRVNLGSPLNGRFVGGAFTVGNGTLYVGMDPFMCGEGYRAQLLASKGSGAPIAVNSNKAYVPGKLTIAQNGHSDDHLSLADVLERFSTIAATGDTKLGIQLFASGGDTRGPVMVFGVSDVQILNTPVDD